MDLRILSAATLCSASLAATALGGCSSAPGSATLPATAAAPALSRPAAAPSPWPASGASFTYAGTLKETLTAGKFVQHAQSSVTQQIRTLAATSGKRPVTDYRGTETEKGSLANGTTNFDLYVAEVPSRIRKGSDLELVKAVASDTNGNHTTVVTKPGNGVFDQIPEVPQARWSNTAARTQSIVDTEAGSSLDDDYRADGSYDQTAVPVEGRTASLQSYGDGNAVYQWPFAGASRNASITFAPPAKGEIQITFTTATPPDSHYFDLKSWYPSNPLVLASDTFTDLGVVRIPPACNVPAKYATSATEILENSRRVDVAFGENESAQRTMFVAAPYGLVCSVIHDETKTYYNFQTATFVPNPLNDVVDDETIGLRTAQVPKDAQAAAGATALPLDVHVMLARAAARLKTARAIFNARKHLEKN